VEVTYTEFNYSPRFILGSDGNYHGTITFAQEYKATLDGKMVYGDRTEKNVEVNCKKHQIAVESGYTVSWEVLLGNIGVTQTDKL